LLPAGHDQAVREVVREEVMRVAGHEVYKPLEDPDGFAEEVVPVRERRLER
jgi:hypothetical protein